MCDRTLNACICTDWNIYNACYRGTHLYITEGYKKKDKEDAQSLSNSELGLHHCFVM